MSEHQISLPDEIYKGLLSAAHADGVTPADWIAIHLPKGEDETEEFAPATTEHLLGAFDSRTPPHKPTQNRVLGRDKGLFTVPDDFNDPLPEDIQAAFEGRA
jgi:hypothetical protein